jgi:cytochrome c peroxidase
MRAALLFGLLFFIQSCSKDPILQDQTEVTVTIPDGFPSLPQSTDNAFTKARIDLGKKLFFEKLLSKDGTVNCSSCHFQEYAFSDPATLSTGIEGKIGFRNAQPLFNLAYRKNFFRDGGVDNLRLSSLNPINNHNEMGTDIVSVIQRLKSSGKYVDDFQLAYQDTISALSILKALECFQRTLISGNSKYDQWKSGKILLTAEEELGRSLFFSNRTNCTICHAGFNFNSDEFKSNGLFETYADSGRQRITTLIEDKGKFIVPSLRNITETAPYMHNGSLSTLEEVIERYNSGGTDFINKDTLIKPLLLSEIEKTALLQFLKTLKDDSFLQNPAFKQ